MFLLGDLAQLGLGGGTEADGQGLGFEGLHRSRCGLISLVVQGWYNNAASTGRALGLGS